MNSCLVLRLTGANARFGELHAFNFASATVKPLVSRRPLESRHDSKVASPTTMPRRQ